jgi:hydroxyethylthiazole kinase
MQSPQSELPHIAADLLDRVRQRRPRVHCITNAVAQTFTANMLLAAGAVPSMTIAPDEVADFVKRANALLVNLGTLDPARREASEISIGAAASAGIPWVLDPVFVERSAPRMAFAGQLVKRAPRAIRLNRAEFMALAGTPADGPALARFANEWRAVLGLTGDVDLVADGKRLAAIANGHALMSRVTAMGCAGSALVGAFLAVEDDAWTAVASALIALGVAGEVAAARAQGPGSFAAGIIDAIYGLERDTLIAHARVS